MIKKHKLIRFDTGVEVAQPLYLCGFFIVPARAQPGHETITEIYAKKYNFNTNKGKTRDGNQF